MFLRRFLTGSRKAKAPINQDALSGVPVGDFADDVMLLVHLIFQSGLQDSLKSATREENEACEDFTAWIKGFATRREAIHHEGVSVTFSTISKGAWFSFGGMKYWVPGKTKLPPSAQVVHAFYERLWGRSETAYRWSSADVDYQANPFTSLERALHEAGAIRKVQRIERAPIGFLQSLPQVAVEIEGVCRPAVVLRVIRERGRDRVVIARPAPISTRYREGKLPHHEEFGTYLPMRAGLGPETYFGDQFMDIPSEEAAWKTFGGVGHTKSTTPLRIETVDAKQCHPFAPTVKRDDKLVGREAGIIRVALDALERYERGDDDLDSEREMEMTNWAFIDHWGLPRKLVSPQVGIEQTIDAWRRDFNYSIPKTHRRWAANNGPGNGLR